MLQRFIFFFFLSFSVLQELNAQSARFTEGLAFYSRKDYSNAISIFKKEAERGDGDAMYMLYSMNKKGEGMSKDSVEQLNWLKKSAATGQPAAMFFLGIMHFQGVSVNKDTITGLKLIQQ